VQMTRPGTLAGIFVVCAIAAWLAVRATFASLPLLPVSTIPVLLVLALVETVTGRYVRNRLAGRGSAKPLAPIAVARLVALAKASSAAAAVVGGLSGGFLVYVLGSLDKTIPARDAKVAGITVASAAVLVAAALYLERCCRAPTPPDDQDKDKPYYDSWSWHQ
jgi:uncharacterized protein DUF3180